MKIDIIGWVERFYLKLPPLNVEIREFVVKYLATITLVAGLLLTVAAVIDFLGTPLISAFTLGGGISVVRDLLIVNSLGVAQGIVMIFAFPGLRAHQQRGWRLLFWSQVIWIISAAISFSPSLLFGLILLYPLVQVKSYYK